MAINNIGYQGGYEHESVDAPPDRVLCKICHYPCRNAHLTSCCGAHFCASCLKQTRKGSAVNKACPMCRVEKFKVFPNKQLDREIKGLEVLCSNRKTGCMWQGEINEFTKHVDDDCLFVDIDCPSGCEAKLKRQCVQDHLANDCPCYCKYCDTSGHSDWITSRHKEHCAMYPLPCPNRCEVGVTRNVGLDEHRRVCPLEIVQCEYYDAGCDIKLVRKDLDSHIKDKMADHLNLIKCYLAKTTEELRKTEKKLTTAENNLEVTKEALDKTSTSYDKLNTRIATAESQVTGISTKTDKRLKDINNKLRRSLHHMADYDEPPVVNDKNSEDRPFLGKITSIVQIICLVVVLFATQIAMFDNRMTLAERKLWPEVLNYMSQLSNAGNQFAPVIYKVTNFSNDVDVSYKWSGNSFLAFEDGYEVFLVVTVAGDDKYKNVIISLLFDKNILEELDYWPLKAMFTVQLLNQVTNNDHFESLIPVDTDNCYLHKTDKNTFVCSRYFISTRYLHQRSHRYLKEDSMYLQVSYIKGPYYHLLRFKNYWFPNTQIFYNTFIAGVWCCVVVALSECLDILDMNFMASRFSSWKFLKFLVKHVLRYLWEYW